MDNARMTAWDCAWRDFCHSKAPDTVLAQHGQRRPRMPIHSRLQKLRKRTPSASGRQDPAGAGNIAQLPDKQSKGLAILKTRLQRIEDALDMLTAAWINALGDWEVALRRGEQAGSATWLRLERIEDRLEHDIHRHRRLLRAMCHAVEGLRRNEPVR
jgi:hypothetical protein